MPRLPQCCHCSVTCPDSTPHLCGPGQSIHVQRPSSVPNCAKCSHTGLIPFNLYKSCICGHHWPQGPDTCSESPGRIVAKQRLQAQVNLTLPSTPPAGFHTLSLEKAQCAGVGWHPSLEALLPEDLCPDHSLVAASPHLTLRILSGRGGGVRGEGQVTLPGGPSSSCRQGHPSS